MPQKIKIGLPILNTSFSETTGSLQSQGGDITSNEVEDQKDQWFQHVGFASRPIAADPGKAAAQGIVIEDTQQNIVIASRDTRGQAIFSDLKAGETCIYAYGQSNVKCKSDGTVVISTTTDNTSGGQGLNITVAGDKISINTPWNNVVVDKTNVTIGNINLAQALAFASGLTELLSACQALATAMSAFSSITPQSTPVTAAQMVTLGGNFTLALAKVINYSTQQTKAS